MRHIVAIFSLLVLTLSCAALGEQHSPMGEYLMGVEDALLEHQMRFPSADPPPVVVVDFTSKSDVLGKCSTVNGLRYLTIYVGEIQRRARTPQQGRLFLAEVLTHELAHGALTCTDADHEVIQ